MRTAVFMSYGVSLADWERQGIREREMRMYRDRSVVFIPGRSDQWHPFLYSLLAPLIHWKTLRRCDEFRSHNGYGLWTSMIARLVFGGRYVVRFGYIRSWDMARRGVYGWKLRLMLWSEWLACRLADEILVGAKSQADYLRAIHGIT